MPNDNDNEEAVTVTVATGDLENAALLAARRASRSPSPKPITNAKPPTSRYVIKDELGSGGAGHVLAALDVETRRLVAIKMPRAAGAYASPGLTAGEQSDLAVAHFMGEASITAQLEHPAIVPIYDVGRGDDGAPYYTMRLVSSRSMHDVLIAQAGAASSSKENEWPLTRLVTVLIQVSRALAYAHARGVLHRDVKPANILVGEYGEVYLADWGIARIATESQVSLSIEHDTSEHRIDPSMRLIGTPGFIAPETISLPSDEVDHRSDLFALGVVLYEVLTGKQPFKRADTPATLLATYSDEPIRPSSLSSSKDCPLLLEDLCLKLLRKDPRDRPESAEDVALKLEEFLEGTRDKARHVEEAKLLCKQAHESRSEHHNLERESARLRNDAAALLSQLKSWEPIPKKKPAWDLEAKAREAENLGALALAKAIERFTRALGHDPTSAEAHRGLADLYWSRARRAERDRRTSSALHYDALVREHDDDGHYASLTKAPAELSIETNPPCADVVLRKYVERDRVLVFSSDEKEIVELGTTPIRHVKVEPGSYLATISCEGFRDVKYPVVLRRGDHHDAGTIDLFTDEEIGEDFVYVPPNLAIGRFPVVAERGGAAGDVPVTNISWSDAVAYCTARSTPACVLRLPTKEEWSLAACGVDGRMYPWGDSFDPTFCNVRDSQEHPTLCTVGTFPIDCSPYGVRDMAGNVREWTSDQFVCGGSFDSDSATSVRCTAEHAEKISPLEGAPDVGFRIAKELTRR